MKLFFISLVNKTALLPFFEFLQNKHQIVSFISIGFSKGLTNGALDVCFQAGTVQVKYSLFYIIYLFTGLPNKK